MRAKFHPPQWSKFGLFTNRNQPLQTYVPLFKLQLKALTHTRLSVI